MKIYRKALLVVLLFMALMACKKSALDYVNEDFPAPVGLMLMKVIFIRCAHSTSQTARIVKDCCNSRFLLFENFGTDNDPDLRVWLS